MNQTKLRVKKLKPFSTMHQIKGTISFSWVRVVNYCAMLIVGGATSFLALTITSKKLRFAASLDKSRAPCQTLFTLV